MDVTKLLFIGLLSAVFSCHVQLLNLMQQWWRLDEQRRRLLLLLATPTANFSRRQQQRTRVSGGSGRSQVGPLPGRIILKNQVVIEEEWRENCRMSRTALVSLSEMLFPHIQRQVTVMCLHVDVVKKNGPHSLLPGR